MPSRDEQPPEQRELCAALHEPTHLLERGREHPGEHAERNHRCH